jgi:hypothetical protein
MKLLFALSFSLLLTSLLNANAIPDLAQKLHLQAGTKASVQWKRIFSSPRHMKKYKVDTLSAELREELEEYLIKHSADSDQPIVPGL